MSGKLRTIFPKSKIKHIMQLDEDVGKIAADVPLVIGRGVELFLTQLIGESAAIAQQTNSSILLPAHMKQCIESSETFDFLKHLVENVADMPAEVAKRSRTASKKKDATAGIPAKKSKVADLDKEDVSETDDVLNAPIETNSSPKDSLSTSKEEDELVGSRQQEISDFDFKVADDEDDEDWDE